jgi:serine/threonine-protein kinase
VLDFGISKMANMAGEISPSITKTGMVMGTPHYMAPEQIRGRDMDHRVDVYAFGVITYQLLSGWLPFPGDTYSELVLKIATEQPTPLASHDPTLPPALVEIVSRAMARDPGARFQSLDELAEAIAPFAGPGAAHLFRSGRPASGGHARKATPSGGTVRLETPLSTQSLPPRLDDLPTERRGPPLLAIGLAVVSIAVIALVITAVVLLNRDPQGPEAAGTTGSDDKAAAEPAPAAVTQAAAVPPAEEPVANTVRVAPDTPQPERRWEPPAAEARVATPEPTARPRRAPVPEEPVAKDIKASKKRKRDRELPAPPAPPTPPTTSTPTAQGTAKQPAAGPTGKRVPGRLGVRMEEGEF